MVDPLQKTLHDMLCINDLRALDALETMITYEPFRTVGAAMNIQALISGARLFNQLYGNIDIHDIEEEDASEVRLKEDESNKNALVDLLLWCEVTNVNMVILFELIYRHSQFVHLFRYLVYHDSLANIQQTIIDWIYTLLEDRFFYEPTALSMDEFSQFLELLDKDAEHRTYTLQSVETWLEEWVRATGPDVPHLLQRWSRFINPTFVSNVPTNLCAPLIKDILKYYIPIWKRDPIASALVYDRIPTWMTELVLDAPLEYADVPFWEVMAGEYDFIHVLRKQIKKNKALAERIASIRRKRHRAAMKAVWCGCIMWRLYQRWSLHPSRLHVETSSLAIRTKHTRQTMDIDMSTSALPLFPTTFRLLNVYMFFKE